MCLISQFLTTTVNRTLSVLSTNQLATPELVKLEFLYLTFRSITKPYSKN